MCDFSCDVCGSPVFTLPGDLEDESPVVCGQCGSHLGTWAERRAEIEAKMQACPEDRRGCWRPESLN
jgi:uncharacterized Zn finger protein (UPF0148 family)